MYTWFIHVPLPPTPPPPPPPPATCSLCTTLCLQWEPQAIAVAFLYLAGKLTKFDLQGLSQSKSRSWWRQFVDTLDFHDLECKFWTDLRKLQQNVAQTHLHVQVTFLYL